MSALHEPIDAVVWQVGTRGEDVGLGRVVLERMDQGDGSALFAVRFAGKVLNRRVDDWVLEAMPSTRDDEFFDACRFPDFESAARAARDQAHKLRKQIEERRQVLAARSVEAGA